MLFSIHLSGFDIINNIINGNNNRFTVINSTSSRYNLRVKRRRKECIKVHRQPQNIFKGNKNANLHSILYEYQSIN